MLHTLKYIIYQPPFIKIIILPSLIMSPMFMMSLNSWITIWISMELNLMIFIPFFIFINKFNKFLIIKYFTVQVFSSSILIFTLLLNSFNFMNVTLNYCSILMNFAILIKLGTVPFHFWFINLMKNSNWINCLILSTWQKIIPSIALIYIFNYYMIILSAILSTFISAIFGLNHQSIRLIMGYSSINHLSWMILNMIINENIWIIYFLSYLIINMTIMLSLNSLNIYYINDLYFIKNNFFIKMMILMNLLSISGLPPFIGFFIKLLSLNYMNLMNMYIMMMLLLFMSIFSFIFYMRICLLFMINLNYNSKIKLSSMIFYPMYSLNLIKIFLLNSFSFSWLIMFWI